MNKKQVAFITCVNDEEEYAECRHYLERLYIPEGHSIDMINIQEAPSMAAGYNAAMKSSDAKYKVYLHQDVFIKNRDFILDLLEIFTRDEQIGMIGMVGCRNLWTDITGLMEWDAGKAIDNRAIFSFDFPRREDGFTEVRAADGFLLATQHDILWREDLFDGWHFYDLSQCMEMKEKGYKVVVPWQEEAWCYHDDSYPRMGSYYDYYELFVHEYGERKDFPIEDKKIDKSIYKDMQEASQIQEDLMDMVEKLFGMGDRIRLRSFFEGLDVRELQCLWEYKLIVDIDQQEEQNQSFLRIWEPEIPISQLVSKIRKLKHALKRIEYGADTDHQESRMIRENYSEYAIADVYEWYIKRK